jgi:flagellar hook-basal body complex protein FliE
MAQPVRETERRMADPLGLIGGSGANQIRPAFRQPGGGPASGDGPSFKDVVMKKLDEVNQLQQQATQAVEDLQSGRRSDVEGVILASNQADNAFRMLQSLRNRLMEAYDEVKQMRT